MDCKKVGAFIAEQRKLKNMTQKELAEQLYVTDKAVSKWERGICFPDISSIIPLSEILNISPSELLNGEKNLTSTCDFAENALTDSIELFENVQKKKAFLIHTKYILILALLTLFFICFYHGYYMNSQWMKMTSSLNDVSYDLFEENYQDILSTFETHITYRDFLYLSLSASSVREALKDMDVDNYTLRRNYPEVYKIKEDYAQTIVRLYYTLIESVESVDVSSDTVVLDIESESVLKNLIQDSLQLHQELLDTMESAIEQLNSDLFGRFFRQLRSAFY